MWTGLALLLVAGCGPSAPKTGVAATASPVPRPSAALRPEPTPRAAPPAQKLRVGKVPKRTRPADQPLTLHQPSVRRQPQAAAKPVSAPPPRGVATAPQLPEPSYPTVPPRGSAPQVVVIPCNPAQAQAQRHWELEQARIRAQNQALIEQAMHRPHPGNWGQPGAARAYSGQAPVGSHRDYYRAQADFLNAKYCPNGPPRWNEHNVAGSLSTVAPPNPVLMGQPALHNPVLQHYQQAQRLRPPGYP